METQTHSKLELCKSCGLPFVRPDAGKGTPQLYYSRMCKAEAKRHRRAVRNATKRKGEESGSEAVDILMNALDDRAHEQMK